MPCYMTNIILIAKESFWVKVCIALLPQAAMTKFSKSFSVLCATLLLQMVTLFFVVFASKDI